MSSESKSSKDSKFENVGLQRWQKVRNKWLSGGNPIKKQNSEVMCKATDMEDVIDSIFSQHADGVLPEPLPLGQMINILIDFWEADGLYD
jgi:hypothetical protein